MLQASLADVSGQILPPKATFTLMPRLRVLVPPPQLTLQSGQASQESTTQSTGQLWVLQSCASEPEGQTLPPNLDSVKDRVRICWPWPQETEQSSQPCQAPTTQSTGHSSVLHERSSVRSPHFAPPWLSLVLIPRVRVSRPPPQVLVHDPQTDQFSISQWIGQGPSVHVCDWVSAGQELPPWEASVAMVRVRDWLPPMPQVKLQASQSPKLLTAQFTGQAWLLHPRDSSKAPQALPPLAAARSSLRYLVWEPPPQLWEQVDHASHVVSRQSTGQLCSSHARVSEAVGQRAPPYKG